ncbi:hypothetical protein WEB32_02430 [Streptomyces netropsis]|uniref:Uncharacterized protein n=1 Tax=Streptomyces netropsis TaxID=55404 RepID=A0A7W7LFD3_STRNE|nr:hypothetical protein [Streptomyces netropsis]MBB4889178.1 hypothetical protein [Streptomyces netropsis]
MLRPDHATGQLERYAEEWQRVLDEMTARGIERYLPVDEKV